MSDAEIERIFRYLEEINKRLAALEKREAAREGADQARSMTRGQIAAWVIGIASVVGVATTVAGQILDRIH